MRRLRDLVHFSESRLSKMIEVQTIYVFYGMQHVRGMQVLEVPMKEDGSFAPGNVSCLGNCERDT